MRKCDHQGVQQGFVVKVVKKQGFDIAGAGSDRHVPGERMTPTCNTMTYKD